MPNHITNNLKLMDDENETNYEHNQKVMAEIVALMKTDKSEFDFNVLIPYPKHFADADKAARDHEVANGSWDTRPKDGFNQGGYEWCCDNWGTKWNAYEVAVTKWDGIYFDTAWATPEPIFRELSKRFPDVTLVVEYADEDIGHNCGTMYYTNGKVSDASEEGNHNFAGRVKSEGDLANARKQLASKGEN